MYNPDDFLTERDRLVFKNAGYGKKFEPGTNPALLVIDATYEFVGQKREPLLEAIKKIRTACGEEAWDAVDNIQVLLKEVRRHNIPVLYTIGNKEKGGGPYAAKNSRSGESASYDQAVSGFVTEIAPEENDVIITKLAPSGFHGTNMLYHLVSKKIDTLLVVGGVTSGCVRATVVDAFSYGFKTILVKEGVFDRGQASHVISLYDMQAKYANLYSVDEALAYLNTLPK